MGRVAGRTMNRALALVLFGFAATCTADHFAVLVAGSSTYGNYRHQADVAHAYHVMIENGIPADNIITMMVEDIATSDENPFKGKIFNRPGKNQTDYYAGLKIDYRGKDVIPANFVAILTGGKSVVTAADGTTKAGKVLKSTKDDNVFVNFVDHGGVNIIGFPETTMHATDLVSALKTSHERGLFKQMVFYLEACESGSMFETLPTDLPIYALTAANAKESSWGTYCSPQDVVDGKSMGTCLGDLFSVNWLQDTEEYTTQLSNGRHLLPPLRRLRHRHHLRPQVLKPCRHSTSTSRSQPTSHTCCNSEAQPTSHGLPPRRSLSSKVRWPCSSARGLQASSTTLSPFTRSSHQQSILARFLYTSHTSASRHLVPRKTTRHSPRKSSNGKPQKHWRKHSLAKSPVRSTCKLCLVL